MLLLAYDYDIDGVQLSLIRLDLRIQENFPDYTAIGKFPLSRRNFFERHNSVSS